MTDFFLRKMEQRDPAFDATPESAAPTILPPLPPSAPSAGNKAATEVIELEPELPKPAGPVQPEPLSVAVAKAAPRLPTGKIFSADTSPALDPLRPDEPLAAVAELLAHGSTPGPLTVGLFGNAGSGKSTALARLASGVTALSEAARALGAASPFLTRLVSVRIDAARIEGEPANAIADGVHQALSAGAFSELAAEAAHAVRDPALVARELGEKLADSRLRLDTERRALQELDGRRARLPESILYETPGSRVDAFARSNRGRIESRMRAFGFSGDPVSNYKDLVRDLGERSGLGGRVSAFLHAMWGFKGQSRLIVFAILLFALAWVLGLMQANGPAWIAWLGANGGENIGPVTNWLGAHLDWLGLFRRFAVLAALACVALNVWRAVRFTLPILRGVALLRADEEARNRDLSGLLSLQTRRVETIAGETETLARQAEAAERRAAANAGASAMRAETPFSEVTNEARTRPAHDFIHALDRAMADGSSHGLAAPQRIVVIIDSLDDLAPARRLAVTQAAHHLLDGRRFATVLAADPKALETAGARLDKFVQLPVRIDAHEADPASWARMFIEGAPATAAPQVDASRSRLDEPLSPDESELIAQLASVTGGSPRAVKQFVNVYRVARVSAKDRPALALMLALLMGGGADDRARLAAKISALDAQLSAGGSDVRMASALSAVERVRGRPLDMDTARRAYRLAQTFTSAA
ncbi:MAG: KAP family NTPase [Beijerinckiaceae bacterium]|nr:KAP family NTPase [Beijerinckiaceae bacterium]